MRLCGVSYQLTHDIDEFKAVKGVKINYSEQTIDNCLHIIPHQIIYEFGIKDYLIEVHSHERFEKYFFRNTKGDFPFDLFGAAFWLLSRYEEYLPFKANKYNVFDYRSSLAWQNGFLEKPLVNIWLNELKNALKELDSELNFKETELKFITTIDVDNVYKFKHKGFVRTLAGILSDLVSRNFTQFTNRIKTIFFNRTDEFDCYPFLIDCNKKYHTKAIFFFLLGDYGVNDKNHPSSNLNFQVLIKHLADYAITGIHPSFASNSHVQQLKIEIVRLATITHKDVIHSRQHFGMLTFPSTYQSLMQSGIMHDYSLGYTNMNGFRASICTPYKWYNISEEQETSLTLHPFCLNDVALDKEMQKDEENVKRKFEIYQRIISLFKGEMIMVFHNDMLSNTAKGLKWRNMYEWIQGKISTGIL